MKSPEPNVPKLNVSIAGAVHQDSLQAKVKAVSLRDQVYEYLRHAILERRLKPGDHIRSQEFAEQLQVSATPLREALGLAERDGLVQYFPNRGWFVAKYGPAEIREIFFIRCGLENLAADLLIAQFTDASAFDRIVGELAAQIQELARVIETGDAEKRRRQDLAFHACLVELSGNRRLFQMWFNIAIQCSMVFNYHTITIPDYDHWLGVRDHTAILDALRTREPANVHAVNDEINRRVAEQCIAGYLAVESQP